MTRTGELRETAPRGPLSLRCFGDQAIEINGQRVSVLTVHAAKAFFLLALSPEFSLESRELGGLLWPDAPESRLASRLARMTWQMRAAVGDEAWRIQRSRTSHVLEIDPDCVDLVVFYRNAELLRTATIKNESEKLRAFVFETLLSPLLPEWSHEPWVQQEQKKITTLQAELTH